MPKLLSAAKKRTRSETILTQKTSGCGRLVSLGQRSVRGVKNETTGAYMGVYTYIQAHSIVLTFQKHFPAV